jgi:hypothetical protein
MIVYYKGYIESVLFVVVDLVVQLGGLSHREEYIVCLFPRPSHSSQIHLFLFSLSINSSLSNIDIDAPPTLVYPPNNLSTLVHNEVLHRRHRRRRLFRPRLCRSCRC